MRPVHFIFRSKQLQRFSIEKVFHVIVEELKKKHAVSKHYLPLYGASPSTLVKNGMFFKKIKGICHITGDAHYLAIFSGTRTLLTIHDVNSAAQGNVLKRLYVRLLWFWLPALRVKKISVISAFTKEELSKIIPFAKNKITVIPNPVDPGFQFQEKITPKERLQVLCIGTKPNKNLSRSILALAQLECEVHITGELTADQKNELEKQQINYTNSKRLSDDAMKQAYIACDIVCFPSTYEGFGMPIIEAQAIGRPVLTSNLGAMQEVAEESACLVDPYDVKSIRKGLIRLLEDNKYRQELVQRGLENVKRYQADKIAERYWEVYKEIDKN